MKEHGDLFKAELVRALLNTKPGTIGEPIDPSKPAKGQTRRVVKPSNSRVNGEPSNRYDWTLFEWNWAVVESSPEPALAVPYVPPSGKTQLCRITPKWSVGDLMWVKETFIHAHAVGGYAPRADPNTDPHGPTMDIIFMADDGPNERTAGPWTPSIFMPRKLSRISMEIKGIGLDQIQFITNIDAKLEGVEPSYLREGKKLPQQIGYKHAFAKLWDQINGKDYPWESNPWVWVREFKMKERP